MKLTKPGNAGSPVYGITLAPDASRWAAFLFADGGSVLNRDGTQAAFWNQLFFQGGVGDFWISMINIVKFVVMAQVQTQTQAQASIRPVAIAEKVPITRSTTCCWRVRCSTLFLSSSSSLSSSVTLSKVLRLLD